MKQMISLSQEMRQKEVTWAKARNLAPSVSTLPDLELSKDEVRSLLHLRHTHGGSSHRQRLKAGRSKSIRMDMTSEKAWK